MVASPEFSGLAPHGSVFPRWLFPPMARFCSPRARPVASWLARSFAIRGEGLCAALAGGLRFRREGAPASGRGPGFGMGGGG